MKASIVGKLGTLGVLACSCRFIIAAAEREAGAPVLRIYSENSPAVEALEYEKLVALKGVHFDSSSFDLEVGEKAALNTLIQRFCRVSQFTIELRGYADGGLSREQNLALSTIRATEIAQYLAERGISPGRILILGLGEVDPKGPTGNPEHQRVDVRIFVPVTPEVTRHDNATRSAVQNASGR